MNEAAAQLTFRKPILLMRRDELFPLARQVVRDSGYQYSKGHSRSQFQVLLVLFFAILATFLVTFWLMAMLKAMANVETSFSGLRVSVQQGPFQVPISGTFGGFFCHFGYFWLFLALFGS